MNKFKDLKVWQKSVELAVEIYKLVAVFPKHERFGLIPQMQQSACSIAFNIAEGAGRGTIKEFNHFLDISLGSACELETQMIIAEKLGYITHEILDNKTQLIEEIQKMLIGLKKSNIPQV